MKRCHDVVARLRRELPSREPSAPLLEARVSDLVDAAPSPILFDVSTLLAPPLELVEVFAAPLARPLEVPHALEPKPEPPADAVGLR
ncbi:MAG TPA: hypothetical protein VK714_02635 [Myxococcota bacterium]|nr:hypothetical protein [Myxococcota bacterium]